MYGIIITHYSELWNFVTNAFLHSSPIATHQDESVQTNNRMSTAVFKNLESVEGMPDSSVKLHSYVMGCVCEHISKRSTGCSINRA